jgi:hypothetical protein
LIIHGSISWSVENNRRLHHQLVFQVAASSDQRSAVSPGCVLYRQVPVFAAAT